MINPLVSIITPCFNGANFLSRLFDSILAQTYDNIEFIFINDGSTDNTEQIALSYVKKFEKRGYKFIYLYQENAGQAAALCNGLSIFSGDYLTWPDSDDFLSPKSIETKVLFLENNSYYGYVRSDGGYINENSSFIENDSVAKDYDKSLESLFLPFLNNVTYCCCGCYMIRSSCFTFCYPNRQIFISRAGQNWQMLIPISYFFKCGFIDEKLYYITIRNGSHSRKQLSLTERYKRQSDLEKIQLQALQVICANLNLNSNSNALNEYTRIVRVRYSKNKLKYATLLFDDKLINDEYNFLKTELSLSFKERLFYLCSKSPFRFLLKTIFNIVNMYYKY